MILRQNHFFLLQTAVESQRIKDQNIRFHCADGDFVAKSTHFKIYSKPLYSILCDIRSADCAEYSVILPDVPMSHILHLNNILINGSSNFDANKLSNVDSLSDVINDVLNTAELLQINISNYGLDLVQDESHLPDEDRAGKEYVEDVLIKRELSPLDDKSDVVIDPREDPSEVESQIKEEGEVIDDDNHMADPEALATSVTNVPKCPSNNHSTLVLHSFNNRIDMMMDLQRNPCQTNIASEYELELEAYRKVSNTVTSSSTSHQGSNPETSTANDLESEEINEGIHRMKKIKKKIKRSKNSEKRLFLKKLNLNMKNVVSRFKERPISKEDNLILWREMADIKTELLKKWKPNKTPEEEANEISEIKLSEMLDEAFNKAKMIHPNKEVASSVSLEPADLKTTAVSNSTAYIEVTATASSASASSSKSVTTSVSSLSTVAAAAPVFVNGEPRPNPVTITSSKIEEEITKEENIVDLTDDGEIGQDIKNNDSELDNLEDRMLGATVEWFKKKEVSGENRHIFNLKAELELKLDDQLKLAISMVIESPMSNEEKERFITKIIEKLKWKALNLNKHKQCKSKVDEMYVTYMNIMTYQIEMFKRGEKNLNSTEKAESKSPEKLHTCQCGAQFANKETFVHHRWYTHYFDLYHTRSSKKVRCTICKKEISSDLHDAHLLAIHQRAVKRKPNQNLVNCKYCSKKFKDFEKFLAHMRGHHNHLRPELYSEITSENDNEVEEADNIPIVDLEKEDFIVPVAEVKSSSIKKTIDMLEYQKEFIIKECVEHKIPLNVLAKKWGCEPDSIETWVREAGYKVPLNISTSTLTIQDKHLPRNPETPAEMLNCLKSLYPQPPTESSPGKLEQLKEPLPAAKLNIKLNNPSDLFPIPPPLPSSSDLFTPAAPPPLPPQPYLPSLSSIPVMDTTTPSSGIVPSNNDTPTPTNEIPMFGKSLSLLKTRTKDSINNETKWSKSTNDVVDNVFTNTYCKWSNDTSK